MLSAKAEAAKAATAAEAPAKKPRYEEEAWDDSKSWNTPAHQEWNASSKKTRHEEDDSWGAAWKGDNKKSSPRDEAKRDWKSSPRDEAKRDWKSSPREEAKRDDSSQWQQPSKAESGTWGNKAADNNWAAGSGSGGDSWESHPPRSGGGAWESYPDSSVNAADGFNTKKMEATGDYMPGWVYYAGCPCGFIPQPTTEKPE